MLMHVLKLKNNNDYIVLRIEGYEFENFKDNIEWLMLYGKVASGKRKVEGEDPTIETTDFEYLKKWAQRLIRTKQNSFWETTEPNLYFRYEKADNTLEIYFCPERTQAKEGKFISGLSFKKECTNEDLEKIVKWCDGCMQVFPIRTPEEN